MEFDLFFMVKSMQFNIIKVSEGRFETHLFIKAVFADYLLNAVRLQSRL
jgi:hypothetical protein